MFTKRFRILFFFATLLVFSFSPLYILSAPTFIDSTMGPSVRWEQYLSYFGTAVRGNQDLFIVYPQNVLLGIKGLIIDAGEILLLSYGIYKIGLWIRIRALKVMEKTGIKKFYKVIILTSALFIANFFPVYPLYHQYNAMVALGGLERVRWNEYFGFFTTAFTENFSYLTNSIFWWEKLSVFAPGLLWIGLGYVVYCLLFFIIKKIFKNAFVSNTSHS